MTDKPPIISFAIPCYNVADFIDNCVQSILESCSVLDDNFEIILVDDGSTKDQTPAMVDAWAEKHPQLIRAIHQSNGGHGMAVNTGLANATGCYFKVVDADDWLNVKAAREIMTLLAKFASSDKPLDMVITNYVYEKVFEGKRQVIRYTSAMPEGREFTWDQLGSFKPQQNILMHAVIYRRELLSNIGFELPAHTFYVDNIFVYVPLPHVQSIYYRNLDVYRYFIGREGQSVNEKVMISRIDQQLRVTRIMIDAYNLDTDLSCPRLKLYMENNILMMMIICTVFLQMSKRDDAETLTEEIWEYLNQHNPGTCQRIKRKLLGRCVTLKGKFGKAVITGGYRLAQKIFKFN